MKPKELQSYTFSALMVVCMVFLIAILIRWEFATPSRAHQPHKRQVQNWQQLKFKGYRSGPSNAPVQIVEFFDFECPFCKASDPALKVIHQKYPQKVSIIYEDFPLEGIHPYAFEAGVAAECARRQNAFMTFHDSLFANQARLGSFSYTTLASRAGVADTVAFHHCVKARKTASIIKSNKSLGNSLGIRGTPTFIINDKLVVGELSIAELDKLVQDALSEAGK